MSYLARGFDNLNFRKEIENAKSAYSMTKGALIAGSRSLAVELAAKKIRVNAVSPGLIITPINMYAEHITNPEKRKEIEEGGGTAGEE